MGSETNRQIASIWSASSARPLTEEDGAEIARNVTGFFAILAEWAAQDEGPAAAADVDAPPRP